MKWQQVGHPVESITIGAGVPSLDVAEEILSDLMAVGVRYISFKPGSIAAIYQVLDIAKQASESAEAFSPFPYLSAEAFPPSRRLTAHLCAPHSSTNCHPPLRATALTLKHQLPLTLKHQLPLTFKHQLPLISARHGTHTALKWASSRL